MAPPTRELATVLRRLFIAHIPPLGERHRRWLTTYVALHAIGYAVIFVATVHFVFLGPGLPDEVTYRHVLTLMEQALGLDRASGVPIWAAAFAALVVVTTVARGWIVYRGYADYPREFGEPVPLDEALTLILVNGLNIAFTPLLLGAIGVAAAAAGYSVSQGRALLAGLVGAAQAAVNHVPTLAPLPRPLAFAFTLLGITFLHYWLHRLGHNRRVLWLLLHRPHHMTQRLCYGTTLPVFMAFPAFLLVALPYTFIFGAMAKLFWPTPLYAEMIIYQLLISVGEIYGHSPALYQRGIRQGWVRFLSFINCQGVYHVLHHSALPQVARGATNNAVNLGSGPFSCWDLLFGTFQPLTDQLPPLGLMGQPRLYLNPLRLLTAGALQLAWELDHNRDLRSWARIVFGPTNYQPPRTRDFAIHEASSDAGVASAPTPTLTLDRLAAGGE